MKALFVGTMADGFALTKVLPDDEAERELVKLLADGKIADLLELTNPSQIDKGYEADENGTNFIVYGKGLGNGFSVFGPFEDEDVAEEFAEDNRDSDDEWERFVIQS